MTRLSLLSCSRRVLIAFACALLLASCAMLPALAQDAPVDSSTGATDTTTAAPTTDTTTVAPTTAAPTGDATTTAAPVSTAAPAPGDPSVRGITDVQLVFVNSTTLLLNVILVDAAVAGGSLRVHIQPEEGNASDNDFAIMPSPMAVNVQGLKPNTKYTMTFTALSASKTAIGATFSPNSYSTHRLGPQISAFYATDPSGTDVAFSVGDIVTLAFDSDCTAPAVGNADQIAALLAFSQPLGAAYSGSWTNARTLAITITDIGQSSPNLGYLTVQVIGDLKCPDNLCDVSRSSSPPLIGSWGAPQPGAFTYFRPLAKNSAGELGAPISNPTFESFHVPGVIDIPTLLPMSLALDSTAVVKNLGVNAVVLFPSMEGGASIGFSLSGRNFSDAALAVGTTRGLLSTDLKLAVPTLTLTTTAGYVGYACVEYTLLKLDSAATLSTAYMNVRIDPPARLYIPLLSAGAGSSSDSPLDVVKNHKTPLIIGLCVVFGVFILIGVGVFLFRRYRSKRDAAGFENASLTEEDAEAPKADAGPTRRFYYDAKV